MKIAIPILILGVALRAAAATAETAPLLAPVGLYIGETAEAFAGKIDGNGLDVVPAKFLAEAGLPDAGANLGLVDKQAIYHVVTLHVPTPGTYRIQYTFSNAPGAAALSVLPLMNFAAAGTSPSPGGLTIRGYAQDTAAALLVTSCGGPLTVDAVRLAAAEEGQLAPKSDAPSCSAPGDAPALAFGGAMAFDGDSDAALKRYLELPADEDLMLLDKTLKAIFPKEVPRDAETKALAILGYVPQVIRMKASATPLGAEVLRDGFAYCYGMARAFVALCRRAGLPARTNALYNIELMETHNMAEVRIGDAWRAVDPTYGVFFYSQEKYRGGRMLSMRDLAAHDVPAVFPLQINRPPWTGQYQPQVAYRPVSKDTTYLKWTFSLPVFYERAFTRAFPIVWAEDAPAVFPILLDMRGKRELALGAADGTLDDLFGKQENNTWRRYAGAPVLGAMPVGHALHLLRVRGDGPGTFRVTYRFLPGAALQGVRAIALHQAKVSNAAAEGDTWHCDVEATQKDAFVLLLNNAGGAPLDMIECKQGNQAQTLSANFGEGERPREPNYPRELELCTNVPARGDARPPAPKAGT